MLVFIGKCTEADQEQGAGHDYTKQKGFGQYGVV